MILYIIPLVISLLGSIIYDVNGKEKGKSFWWGFLFIYLTLFMGLRYKVGGDTVIYMGDYYWVNGLEEYQFISANRYEPGFNLLMSIGKSISTEFVAFQLLHIILINSLLFAIIHRYGRCRYSILLCLLFYPYYYFATEVLRESVAVLLFIYFFIYYEKREWMKYYTVVILCMLMHISAVILLILPLARGLRFNKNFVFIIILTIMLGVLLKPIFNILNNIAMVAERTSNYQSQVSHGMMAGLLQLTRLAIYPLIVGVIIIKSKLKKEFRFENMVTLLILLGILVLFNPIIFGRFTNYFILFFMLTVGNILPQFLKSCNRIALRNAIVLFLLFVMVYGSSYIMYGYYKRLVPYYSVFNPIDVNRDNFTK